LGLKALNIFINTFVGIQPYFGLTDFDSLHSVADGTFEEGVGRLTEKKAIGAGLLNLVERSIFEIS
jgi:hypothetical protein